MKSAASKTQFPMPRNKGDLEDGGYDIRILPQPKTLGDILTGNGATPRCPSSQKSR